MIPRLLLAVAEVPGGTEPLRLFRRGDDYSIMLGANELMNSRLSGSEEALARLCCAPIAGRAGARVLIGGLGMGFTLRATLALLADDARVIVAELVSAVVAWARGPMADLHGGSLDDSRVSIDIADVAALIARERGVYDAILLDVDNGPDGLSRASNDALYSAAGLAMARAALKPGGTLGIWSSASDQRFTRRLKQAGFDVEEKTVRAHATRGARHTIWVGTSQA